MPKFYMIFGPKNIFPEFPSPAPPPPPPPSPTPMEIAHLQRSAGAWCVVVLRSWSSHLLRGRPTQRPNQEDQWRSQGGKHVPPVRRSWKLAFVSGFFAPRPPPELCPGTPLRDFPPPASRRSKFLATPRGRRPSDRSTWYRRV